MLQTAKYVYKICTNQNCKRLMMYYKCTKNSYWYTKIIQTVHNLYKHQPEMSLKLAMYFFYTYKRYTNYTKSIHLSNRLCLKFPGYVLCTYILCTNYTKSIQLLNWNCRFIFFVHTKFEETMQNLYNYSTETVTVYFLYIQNLYKLYKIYTTNYHTWLERRSVIFCICTQRTNHMFTRMLNLPVKLVFFLKSRLLYATIFLLFLYVC